MCEVEVEVICNIQIWHLNGAKPTKSTICWIKSWRNAAFFLKNESLASVSCQYAAGLTEYKNLFLSSGVRRGAHRSAVSDLHWPKDTPKPSGGEMKHPARKFKVLRAVKRRKETLQFGSGSWYLAKVWVGNPFRVNLNKKWRQLKVLTLTDW